MSVYPVDLYPGCPCYACDSPTWRTTGTFMDNFPRRMSLCPTCGNKRCPGASNHRRGCSGSNDNNQDWDAYPLPEATS